MTQRLPLVLATGVALALAGAAGAQERARTLNDARSDVIHGSGGITLFDFGRKTEPAPAAHPAPAAAGATGQASAAPAPTSGWGTPLPAQAKAQASTVPASAAAPTARKPLFGNLGEIFGPPTGESLSSAKKHESPSSGIALPTGR